MATVDPVEFESNTDTERVGSGMVALHWQVASDCARVLEAHARDSHPHLGVKVPKLRWVTKTMMDLQI